MNTSKLRRLASRVKTAHIKITVLRKQFTPELTTDESKSLEYIATLLSGLYVSISRRADASRDPRGAAGKSRG